jgi:class 3 adenylate cyclase
LAATPQLIMDAPAMSIDIADWLRGLGLDQYAQLFRDNDIDGEILGGMNAEDLKELGISSFGHRRRLLNAITALGGAPATRDVAQSSMSVTPAPVSPPIIDAERRQLTVMFCDLVGSTPLSTRFDPEDLREIVGAYHRCVTDTVGRFSGFVAKYMGDGVLVYFGYPEAHEDDAERAARAGLGVIDAVCRLATQEPLNVRIGIASGLVVVGDLIGVGAAQERGVVGETPNLAARLQALARPGTLVVADSTRRQVGTLFEIEDLGPQPLAGFAGPQPAWRVVGESGVVSRFEALRSGTTPLVGRDDELDLLSRRWQQAKSGEGRVVLVSGEPGIGKSRLTAALSAHIETEPHTRLRYFCSPHDQESALYPFIGQLERAAGFARDDTTATRLDKLEALLGDGAEPGDLSLIAEMLSLSGGERFPPLDLSPQRKKERTLAALLRQLQALARRQPVLMIFEDLHWIDPTSRELLDLTVERIAALPVLLVVTYRPEFQPLWVGGSQVTVIALNRLGRNEGARLVHRLAGNLGALSPDVVDEIVERTDGVPLFVEELTKAVVEAGAGRGHVSISAVPPSSLAVPATLHASLLGRLDRLGPLAKTVAQVGAAIGRDFSYELLAAAAQLAEPELQEALRRLVEAGLVFQRGVPPAAEYLFKHALVQDTAYSTLLRGPRQTLHRRIAEALEQRFPDFVEPRPEIVAHHYGAAAIADKAVTYWHLAGKMSVAKSAVREATVQLRRGLGLLEGLPETRERKQLELDIHVTLTTALMAGKGYADPEVFAALERTNRFITETGAVGTPVHFLVLYGLWVSNAVGGTVTAALDHATNFLSSAQSQSSSSPLLVGHRILGHSLTYSGDYAAALAHLQTAASLYRPDEHRDSAFHYGQDIGVSAFVQFSWALWHRGYPDQSSRAADRALALSRELGHAHTLSHALYYTGMAAVFSRNIATVCSHSNDCVALASEHGFAYWAAFGRILQGWAGVQRGEATAGIALIRDGMTAAEATGARVYTPLFLALLAEALRLPEK